MNVVVFKKVLKSKEGKEFSVYYAKFGQEMKNSIKVKFKRDSNAMRKLISSNVPFPIKIDLDVDDYFICDEKTNGSYVLDKNNKRIKVLIITNIISDISHVELPRMTLEQLDTKDDEGLPF